jgi:hypothetical protein
VTDKGDFWLNELDEANGGSAIPFAPAANNVVFGDLFSGVSPPAER